MTQTDSKSADASGEGCAAEIPSRIRENVRCGLPANHPLHGPPHMPGSELLMHPFLATDAALPADASGERCTQQVHDGAETTFCGQARRSHIHNCICAPACGHEHHPFASPLPADERERTTEQKHYRSLIEHVDANSARHPWYGPCDGIGKGGSCCECDNLIAASEPSWQKRRERSTRRRIATDATGWKPRPSMSAITSRS